MITSSERASRVHGRGELVPGAPRDLRQSGRGPRLGEAEDREGRKLRAGGRVASVSVSVSVLMFLLFALLLLLLDYSLVCGRKIFTQCTKI